MVTIWQWGSRKCGSCIDGGSGSYGCLNMAVNDPVERDDKGESLDDHRSKAIGDRAKACMKNFRIEEDAWIYRQVYIFGYGNMRAFLSRFLLIFFL